MRGHSAKDIRGAELGDLFTIARDNALDASVVRVTRLAANGIEGNFVSFIATLFVSFSIFIPILK